MSVFCFGNNLIRARSEPPLFVFYLSYHLIAGHHPLRQWNILEGVGAGEEISVATNCVDLETLGSGDSTGRRHVTSQSLQASAFILAMYYTKYPREDFSLGIFPQLFHECGRVGVAGYYKNGHINSSHLETQYRLTGTGSQ